MLYAEIRGGMPKQLLGGKLSSCFLRFLKLKLKENYGNLNGFFLA